MSFSIKAENVVERRLFSFRNVLTRKRRFGADPETDFYHFSKTSSATTNVLIGLGKELKKQQAKSAIRVGNKIEREKKQEEKKKEIDYPLQSRNF